ncbi:MAG TPA: PhzF family phenazine biosynthesis protein [Gemmatimonadaceae bacterium]|nr:PhzF family phenazine biosynthesis protein [Gemmatimonadaceae bacterium]
MRIPFFTADVFTSHRFGGNQLAVFPDATSIPEELLLDITREFNYSETVFVHPPASPAHTRRLRIFTPGGEVPFAGHPTVGTAHVLAATGHIALDGAETRIVFEEKIGPVPVTIFAESGKPVRAQLSVAKLPEIGPPPPSRERLAEVLGLETQALLAGKFGPQAVSCGLPFLFVPVRDRKAVARARVRLDRWEPILATSWAPEIFVFARDAENPGSDIRARMFAPGMSVPEDPATGSACAALAGYLAARDTRRDGILRWVVEQGFEMGRPSILEIEADKSDGTITAIRVAGATVMVAEGTLDIG